jgi:hypothetical protein
MGAWMALGGHLTGQRGRAEDAWLATVADAAAASAGAPVELLGEYLTFLADAAVSGRRPQKRELQAVRELGRRAAEQGVGAGQAVDLYLSAAWRLWRELPAVVRTRDRHKVRAAADAVLRVIDDAVEVLVEGHQAARRQMVRQEEALRREFIDDLLRGDADVSRWSSGPNRSGSTSAGPIKSRSRHRSVPAPYWTGRRSLWNASSLTNSGIAKCWSQPRTAGWSCWSRAIRQRHHHRVARRTSRRWYRPNSGGSGSVPRGGSPLVAPRWCVWDRSLVRGGSGSAHPRGTIASWYRRIARP